MTIARAAEILGFRNPENLPPAARALRLELAQSKLNHMRIGAPPRYSIAAQIYIQFCKES